MRTACTTFLIAAIIGKAVAVLAIGPASIEMDAAGYWSLGNSVGQGDWLLHDCPIAYRTPMYPWFLAAVQAVAGQHALTGIVILQAVLAILAVWIAGNIARLVTQSSWARPLTLLVSLPTISHLVYASAILTETLFTFFLMLHLLLVAVYLRHSTWTSGLLAGLTFGLTLLTRPIVGLLWMPHLIALILIQHSSTPAGVTWKQRTSQITVAALVTLTCVTPWLIRNQRLFDQPFLTEFLGRNLWIVTFQDGSGAGLDFPDTEAGKALSDRIGPLMESDAWRSTWSVSAALVGSGLSDPETDRLMKQVAWDAVPSDPWAFAYKTVRRTVNFWRCAVTDLPLQGSDTGEYHGQRHWSLASPVARYAIDHRLSREVWFNTIVTIIIALSVLVLILHKQTRHYGIWLGLILGYFAAVTGALEIPNYRYRMVCEPLAAAVVSSALVGMHRTKAPPISSTG